MRKILAYFVLFAGIGLYAGGPHDGITCLGCHDAHYAIDDKLLKVKNSKATHPITKESLDKLVARNCLGCHETPQFGGAGVKPMHLHNTHPIGMVPNPKIADVPAGILKNGVLDCVSCHEVHPSNQNFRYLRVAVGAQGENVQVLCATCHSAKVDMKAAGLNSSNDIKVFTAMDQQQGAGFYLRDKVRISNPTPSYIKPLGKLPENSLMPAYLNIPDWVMNPEFDPYETKAGTKETNATKPAAATAPAAATPAPKKQ